MAYGSRAIPEEDALLCEGCGYIVSGLPQGSSCPECAKPVVESLPDTRQPTLWERQPPGRGRVRALLCTSWQVLAHPRQFFRSSTTRAALTGSRRFALVHNGLSSLLFGFAGFVQSEALLIWMGLDAWANWEMLLGTDAQRSMIYLFTGTLTFAAAVFLVLTLTIRLAARLTAWEAAIRGLRLPLAVVIRAMHYHSAHYVPVALVAAATVGAYHLLRRLEAVPITWESGYIYLLCGQVVVGAGYLFKTYWIAMRNIMFANR